MNTLSQVLEAVNAHPARPLLIGIDGYGGSGKSTLSVQLSKVLACPVIHGDDFYRVMPEQERSALTPAEGAALYFDWQRLISEVLIPIRAGQDAKFQRYDWEHGGGIGGWVNVAAHPTVIVEGVYMARPELRPYFQLLIYVTTSELERMQRLQARTWYDPAWTARWDAAEAWYHDHHEPEKKAQFVVSGAS